MALSLFPPRAGRRRPSVRGYTLVELTLAVIVIGVLATLVIFGYQQWQARTWRSVLLSDVRSFAIAEELRRVNPNNPGAVDSTADVLLTRNVTLLERFSRPQEWQVVVRHEPTNQTCWGRWSSLTTPPVGMRTGCGPIPTDSAVLAGNPVVPPATPAEVITPRLTITGPAGGAPWDEGSILLASATGSSSSVGGSTLSYIWQALPLASSGGISRALSYPTAGDYVVRLTVNGSAGGTASADTIITILPRVPRVPTTIAFLGDTIIRSVAGVMTPSPVVAVRDQFGAIMVAEPVTFTSSAGGTVSSAPVLTGFTGEAIAPSWDLASGTPILTATAGAVSARLRATVAVVSSWQMRLEGSPTWGTSIYRRVVMGSVIPAIEYRALDAGGQPVAGGSLRCGTVAEGDLDAAAGTFGPEILTLFHNGVRTTSSAGLIVIGSHTATLVSPQRAQSYVGYAITCRGHRGGGVPNYPFGQQMRIDIQFDFLGTITVNGPPAGVGENYAGGFWRWNRGEMNLVDITGSARTQAGLPAAFVKLVCGRHRTSYADVARGYPTGGPAGTVFMGDTVITDASGNFIVPKIVLDDTEPWESYGECWSPVDPISIVSSAVVPVGPWYAVEPASTVAIDPLPAKPFNVARYRANVSMSGTATAIDLRGRPVPNVSVLVSPGVLVRTGTNGTVTRGMTFAFIPDVSFLFEMRIEPKRPAGSGGAGDTFCMSGPPPDGAAPGTQCPITP